MSSKSRRQCVVVHSFGQINKIQQSDAITNIMVVDLKYFPKKLLSDKKRTEERQYVIWKTKRIGEFWVHFYNYFENDFVTR